MRFVKMHGAGNDYVYVDCFESPEPTDPGAWSRLLADRHTGVGGDGLVLIGPPTGPDADARMRMFNADGSEAEMCGNAIRCVAKHLHDRRRFVNTSLAIETPRGVLRVDLDIQGGDAVGATVAMGGPILRAAEIPTTLPGEPPIEHPLTIDDEIFALTCVSMGNPHAVAFIDEPTNRLVHGVGPRIERHGAFPNRTNVEFVRILSRSEAVVRVWERGSGETQACGTGACAVCVAGVLAGRLDREVTLHMPGGDLHLHWREQDDEVLMRGPAATVFEGTWTGPPPE